jgi:hypothetical protein
MTDPISGKIPDIHNSSDWWIGYVEDLPQLVVRARKKRPGFAGMGQYPTLVVITWTYHPMQNGMPHPNERQQQVEMETILEKAFTLGKIAVLTSCIIGGGVMEWEYYTRGNAAFLEELNAALADRPRFPVQIRFYDDPDWESFRTLLEARGLAPQMVSGERDGISLPNRRA